VERTAINRLAEVEQLPASTLARRMLLQEAQRRGLFPLADQHDTQEAGHKEPCHQISWRM